MEARPELFPSEPARLLQLLACGAMRDEQGAAVRWSSNYTFLVGLTESDDHALAIYKPQRGERPLWDFPDGTLCYREVAAYQVSAALGWDIVPPTVLRNGLRGVGSVQLYIDHDPEVNYFTLDERYHDQLRKICAFDYLINNADRKGGHILLGLADHLWGIDHGLGFHPAPKLRTVVWDFAGEPIPDDLLTDIDRLDGMVEDEASALRQSVEKLLAPTEIQAFRARLRRLLQRGEYPRQGPGPNYPWPPV